MYIYTLYFIHIVYSMWKKYNIVNGYVPSVQYIYEKENKMGRKLHLLRVHNMYGCMEALFLWDFIYIYVYIYIWNHIMSISW